MTRRRKPLLVVGAAAMAISVLVVACSSSDNPPVTGGSTTDEGGLGVGIDHQVDQPDHDSGLVFHPPDGGDGGITCPVPAFGGATVNATVMSGSPPASTGGVITPGTYDLTGLELFQQTSGEDDGGSNGGVAMDHARGTFVITADMINFTETASPPGGGAEVVTSYVAKQHVSDVFLVTEQTCPDTVQSQTPFTATATTVRFHTAQLRNEIFTRRP